MPSWALKSNVGYGGLYKPSFSKRGFKVTAPKADILIPDDKKRKMSLGLIVELLYR